MDTLYEQLGGHAGMRTAVSVMYQRVTADPLLEPWFAGIDMDRLSAHQRAFLAAAFDGPPVFTGRELADAHTGMEITDEAFERVAQTLIQVLDELGASREALSEAATRIEALRRTVVDGSRITPAG